MTIKKVKFLVGMPGSGKTTLGNALVEKASPSGSILFVDDISIVTKNPKEYLANLNTTNVSELIIADVFLCRSNARESALKILSSIFPDAKIEFLFFENSIEKCLVNVNKRAEQGDDRKVTNLIKLLSKEYIIPEGVTPIDIKHEISNKLKI